MKTVVRAVVAVLALSLGAARAGEPVRNAEPTQQGEGTWFSKGVTLSYAADAITQRCYVFRGNQGGMLELPCEVLAKRPEWKPILTWVK